MEQAAKETGGTGHVVDARDEQATRDFFDRIGPVDNVVINVSGRGQAAGPLSAITADALRQAVEDKLIPHLLTAKAAATALSERASIAFVVGNAFTTGTVLTVDGGGKLKA